MLLLSHIVLLVAICEINALIKLPDIKPCHPKNAECLKNLLRGLQQQVMQDIPDASLPSLDTLNLPNYNQSNPFLPEITYFAKLSNLQYSGLLNFNISKFEVDLDNLRLILKIEFPLIILRALGDVSIYGLGVKLEGEGPVKLEFHNLTVALLLFATESLENENRYLKWRQDLIFVSFDRGVHRIEIAVHRKLYYQNYLDKLATEHPEILNSEAGRVVKNTLAEFMFQYLNSVHKSHSVDELYLPETK